MPSSPKVSKELMLQKALEIVIREGYDSLNIKHLASEVGCSTQPISWQFKNMEGLRDALAEYATEYANSKFVSDDKDPIEVFNASGVEYLSMAINEPFLFKFLYLNGYKGQCMNSFASLTEDKTHASIITHVAKTYDITVIQAAEYVKNTIIYTHGMGALLATGVISSTLEEAIELMRKTATSFLENYKVKEV